MGNCGLTHGAKGRRGGTNNNSKSRRSGGSTERPWHGGGGWKKEIDAHMRKLSGIKKWILKYMKG